MSFLDTMMNTIAMNKLKHENGMAALAGTCQISGSDLPASYSYDDVASQCYCASFQINA